MQRSSNPLKVKLAGHAREVFVAGNTWCLVLSPSRRYAALWHTRVHHDVCVRVFVSGDTGGQVVLEAKAWGKSCSPDGSLLRTWEFCVEI